MQSTIVRKRPESPVSETSDVVGVDRLFREHAAYVAAFLCRLGIAADAVDDAVQEVFLVAHKCGCYRPGPASPRTWLGAITIRVAANARRAKQRRREVFDSHMLEQPCSSHPADVLVEHRQELAQVDRAMQGMSDMHRDVFLRFAVVGDSCDDIAQSTGVPTGTVYSRLHAARFSLARARTALMRAA